MSQTQPNAEELAAALQEQQQTHAAIVSAAEDALARAEDASGNAEQSEAPKSKKRSRSLFGFRIVRVGAEENGEHDASPAPAKPKKAAKPPKAKKPKVAKKPKAKKAKSRSKAAAHAGAKDGKPSRSKLPLILLLVLVVLGSATFVFFRMRGPNTPTEMLAQAEKLTGEGKFEQAIDLYGKVIDEGELVVEAYLGIADTFQEADEPESALPKLEVGYADTGDARLLYRYEDIAGAQPLSAEGVAASIPQPIRWEDPAFEDMIRRALNIPAGVDIYESDLSSVTTLRILGSSHAVAARGGEATGISNRNDVNSYEVDGVTYTERGGITSLRDVRHFPNLTRLTVAYNNVRSIDGVQELSHLRMLALYANEIEDLSPLSGATTIRWLYLYNNNITDISPLASLVELEELSLQHNSISDLSPLSGLTGLEQLFMSSNRISDLSPLASMTQLRFLFLQNNGIGDISVVAGLPALTDINFSGNPVADYSPASHVFNINRSFVYS